MIDYFCKFLTANIVCVFELGIYFDMKAFEKLSNSQSKSSLDFVKIKVFDDGCNVLARFESVMTVLFVLLF